MAGNFAALWPTDPKFSALKDLNPFKTVSKVQEASSILRVVFALSKWPRPHLHRAYLVTVRFHLILAVYVLHSLSSGKCVCHENMLLVKSQKVTEVTNSISRIVNQFFGDLGPLCEIVAHCTRAAPGVSQEGCKIFSWGNLCTPYLKK